jgi:hypothetical protein
LGEWRRRPTDTLETVLPRTLSSPNRRWLALGVLIAVAAGLLSIVMRRDGSEGIQVGGNVSACARLEGDAARKCYGREVGRELAAVADAGVPDVQIAAPSGSAQVTFAATEAPPPLLCDLHARVGVIDEQVPSWLGWTEPLAEAAPQS